MPPGPERVKGGAHIKVSCHVVGLPPLDLSGDDSLRQGIEVNLIPGHNGVCRIVRPEAAKCPI